MNPPENTIMKTIAQQLNVKTFPFSINDENNNEIYYENSGGYWCKREFDTNNNQTHFENSGGYWCKREFDTNNNQTHFENSGGFWTKREFDNNNNETHFENSGGYIRDNRTTELTLDDIAKKFNIDVKKLKVIK